MTMTPTGTRSPLISAAELRALVADEPDGCGSSTAAGTSASPGAGRAAYAAGHLPGAIHLDLDADLADPDGYGAPGRHPLPSPARVRRRARPRPGSATSDLVVAYDDVGGWVAARLWWMLDVLGHARGRGPRRRDRGVDRGRRRR